MTAVAEVHPASELVRTAPECVAGGNLWHRSGSKRGNVGVSPSHREGTIAR